MLQEPVALRDFKPTAEIALGVLEDFADHDAVRAALSWITGKIEVMPGDDGRAFIRADRVTREWLASLAPEPIRMLAGMVAVVHREMFTVPFVNREAYAFSLIKIAGQYGSGKSTVDRVTSKGRTAQRILVPPRGAAVRLGQLWLDQTAPFLLSIARHVDIRRKEGFQNKPKQLAALPV